MLKKILFSTVLFSVFTLSTNAQVFEKGDKLVDIYYGGPNGNSASLETKIISRDIQSLSSTSTSTYVSKYSSFGPVGLKFEYSLSSLIGIGINANVSYTTGTGTIINGANTYDYKVSAPRIRVMPTLNFHLGQSEKFDKYFSFGAGYASFNAKETTPLASDKFIKIKPKSSPLALRAEFGMRYYFTDHIGIGIQFGIGGGPLVGGGVSFKF